MAYTSSVMKLMTISTAALAMIGAAALATAPRQDRQPLIVAHRGGAALMPENTFPAFDHALRLGVDWLEFDMVMTADNQLIIQHDPTVNATFCAADPATGVTPRPVRELTLAQVLAFDCGSKHRAIYPRQVAVPGARMPTPDDFFTRYKKSKAVFYGETKMPGPGEGEVDPVAFARMVAAAVRKHDLEDRFILQSSDWRTLDAMHAINPRIRTCLLGVWKGGPEYLKTAQEHHATCMLLRIQDAGAAQVKALQSAGILVVSEVIDDEESWRQYRDRGDDALFTNDPAGLIAFLRSNASRR
jgi:glycerophosphoryl diester phosphodiesterase